MKHFSESIHHVIITLFTLILEHPSIYINVINSTGCVCKTAPSKWTCDTPLEGSLKRLCHGVRVRKIPVLAASASHYDSCAPCLEYLIGPMTFFSSLWQVSRAAKDWWNDVEILHIVQPAIEWRHRKWRWVIDSYRSTCCIHTLHTWLPLHQSTSITYRKQMRRFFVCFCGCRSHRCWRRRRT